MKTTKTLGKVLAALIFCASLYSCSNSSNPSVQDRRIEISGQTQYYVGTNLWYAGRLAATEEGLERLRTELDYLHSMGVDNLRVLAVEGEDLASLRVALDEMEKRGMYAVLFLNNAWEWSYGFVDYLERAGAGNQQRPSTDGYGAFMRAMAGFAMNQDAINLNHEYIRKAVSELRDSKAIFSWQISNEPRAFNSNWENQTAFVNYIHSTAALIKSLDPDHMVSTGNEGSKGCEESLDLVRRINDCKDIDYITIHIWPYNWGWVKEGNIAEGVDTALSQIDNYIDEHLQIAKRLGKSVVIEEFGYPRDGFEFAKGTPTTGRDKIYKHVFDRVIASAQEDGLLAGCNFWGWGGFAKQTPGHIWYEEGDDFCGDPGQEQQGLNSVYVDDESTVAIIREANEKLRSMTRIEVPMQNGWLYTGKDKRYLKVSICAPEGTEFSATCHFVSDTTLMTRRDTVLSLTQEGVVSKGGKCEISFDFSPLTEGFYEVNLSCSNSCGEVSHPVFNIGIDPEKIVSPIDRQDDFDEFWQQTLSELSKVPLNLRMTYSPEHSNDIRKSYIIEADSFDGGKIGGYLCIPTKPGVYPAHINYMGYGAQPYFFDPSNRPETVEFLVSVRDQGIFREGNDHWIERGLTSKEEFYYRGAFADCVRAIDVIASLDCVDTDNIYAWGESQGGAFTLAAAALDHRIKAAAPAVPFLGDYRDYYKIVWWPVWEVMEEVDRLGLQREEVYTMLSYFDIKNFADHIECPVFMAFGLQDPTCPPHTNFSEYNLIKTEKHYYCSPRCGHGMWEIDEWAQLRNQWLDSIFNNQ